MFSSAELEELMVLFHVKRLLKELYFKPNKFLVDRKIGAAGTATECPIHFQTKYLQ